jgi:alpha-galactosidase
MNVGLLALHRDLSTISFSAKPYSTGTATNPPEFYADQSQKGTYAFIINIGSSSASNTTSSTTSSPSPRPGRWELESSRDVDSEDLGTFTDLYTVVPATHGTAALLVISGSAHVYIYIDRWEYSANMENTAFDLFCALA